MKTKETKPERLAHTQKAHPDQIFKEAFLNYQKKVFLFHRMRQTVVFHHVSSMFIKNDISTVTENNSYTRPTISNRNQEYSGITCCLFRAVTCNICNFNQEFFLHALLEIIYLFWPVELSQITVYWCTSNFFSFPQTIFSSFVLPYRLWWLQGAEGLHTFSSAWSHCDWKIAWHGMCKYFSQLCWIRMISVSSFNPVALYSFHNITFTELLLVTW